MAFQLSPGVQVTEKDLTSVVPAVGTSIGGYAGEFSWGPVDQIVTVSSENELVSRFGKPASTNAGWFACASFLAYTSTLKIVRSVDTVAFNAGTNVTSALVKNADDYYQNHSAGDANNDWFAKYPGVIGNSIKVEIMDSSTYAASANKGQFDYAPDTTSSAAAVNSLATDDEVHVLVIDEDGVITGTAGTVLERWAGMSKASDAKDSYGQSLYYKDVINARSSYVWWGKHLTGHVNWGTPATSMSGGYTLISAVTLPADAVVSLIGGVDAAPEAGDIVTSLALFANDEVVDVNLLFAGAGGATVGSELINIANTRKDCMAFVSPLLVSVQSATPAADIVAELASYPRNSFGVFDSGWKYMLDRYNDRYVWVPCNGDIAGLCALTDNVADPWFSPAGYNRGAIKNAVKLAYSPNKTDRDTLYKAGVNPVVGFPGAGIVLFGDKTLLPKPSAFDRINVRRLFIVLEKAIATAAKFQLFEFNDAFTRGQFRNLVEPFLRDVQGRRGIYDFRVVCNETNNTSQVIDTNGFVADIFIQPARSINFIQLNFIATRTGVSFEEVGG